MKLIVGLGNPGPRFANNRHNIGFMCLSHFARAQGIKLDKKHANARVGFGEIAGVPVVLAWPQTYVNESGKAVSRLVKKFDVDLDDLVVIHDDLDLSVGRLRIRSDGSSGGHKGIESIIWLLGGGDFVRFRVGIGRPVPVDRVTEISEADIIEYVLGDFTPGQKQIMEVVTPRVTDALVCLLTEGLVATMNQYNRSAL